MILVLRRHGIPCFTNLILRSLGHAEFQGEHETSPCCFLARRVLHHCGMVRAVYNTALVFTFFRFLFSNVGEITR